LSYPEEVDGVAGPASLLKQNFMTKITTRAVTTAVAIKVSSRVRTTARATGGKERKTKMTLELQLA
jgi:hypothetical protein